MDSKSLLLFILIASVINFCDSFGCTSCGRRQEKRRWLPHAVKVPTPASPTPQAIVNTFCKSHKTVCHLENKGINKLDHVIFPPNTTILHLSHNNIKSIPNTTKFPPKLLELYLDSNKIHFDSANSLNLTYLTSLHTLSIKLLFMEGNKIQSFRNIDNLHLSNLPLLDQLQLNGNQISMIHNNLQNILPISLNVLGLSHNGLREIHTYLPRKLTVLDLRNNPLENVRIFNRYSINCVIQMEDTPLTDNPIKENIARLPKLIWNRQKSAELKCQVCCMEYEQGDMVRTLPCLHQFHCQCVDPWLEKRKTCPECRHNINVVE